MVTIDFTVYNANINLFCIVKLLFEFPPTGGVTPMTSFYTVKLLRHVDSLDYFIFACELIFVCFLLFYVVEESLEIMKHKCDYFSSLSNDLDIVVLVVSRSRGCRYGASLLNLDHTVLIPLQKLLK